jgi:hypothetical protein
MSPLEELFDCGQSYHSALRGFDGDGLVESRFIERCGFARNLEISLCVS